MTENVNEIFTQNDPIPEPSNEGGENFRVPQ